MRRQGRSFEERSFDSATRSHGYQDISVRTEARKITLRYIQIARRRRMIRKRSVNLQHQVKMGHGPELRILL